MNLLTRTDSASAVPRTARWLAAGLLTACFVIPTQAMAQAGCNGSGQILSDGTDSNGNFVPDYLYQDLPEPIQWTLTPASGTLVPITVSEVRFGLTCFNNGDQVPCANGNDGQEGNNDETPVQYVHVGAIGGDCGATLSSNENGVVTFALPEATLDQEGCTIIFDTLLEDRGIDGTPNLITPAAAFDGTCSIGGEDIEGGAQGSAIIEIINPAIEVTKTGPDTAKVGDGAFDYTISFTVLSAPEALGECTLSDPVLGIVDDVVLPDTPYVYPYTPSAGDPNPLVNTATVTCAVNNSASTVFDDDTWEVDLIDPAIEVSKIGPPIAKVGDQVTYTIGFTATGTGTLENCTGSDSVIGALGAFEDGVPRDFNYTVQPDDPDPLVNIATITCDVAGFDNQTADEDSHTMDLINPSVDLTKACRPDPVEPGQTIEWAITVANTGDIDLDCTVNDPTAGYTDEPVTVPAGGSETLNASRTVEEADFPVISNTASVECPIPGFDNSVSDEDTADCEVLTVEEICRTPGFWGTHAGVEKEDRSTNLTQEVIDYNGGSLGTICGVEITNTSVNDYDGFGSYPGNGDGSAVEGICVHPKTQIVRQLARQLIAASLNCVMSGGGEDCTGVSIYDDFTAANAACTDPEGDYSYWIGIIDDFNNGISSPGCHDRNLTESDVFADVDYKVPGPAGSSRACSAATKNDFYLVP